MKFTQLLNVIEDDTKINVVVDYKEVYDGYRGEYNLPPELMIDNKPVKMIWYSSMYNRLMIEL